MNRFCSAGQFGPAVLYSFSCIIVAAEHRMPQSILHRRLCILTVLPGSGGNRGISRFPWLH